MQHVVSLLALQQLSFGWHDGTVARMVPVGLLLSTQAIVTLPNCIDLSMFQLVWPLWSVA